MVIVQVTFIVMVTAQRETWTWEVVNMCNWAINCDMGNKSLGFIMLSMPCASFHSSEMLLCSSSLYANTMLDVIAILWFQSIFDRVTSGQVCHWTCYLISPMNQKYIYYALNPEPLCLKCLFTYKTFCIDLDGHLYVAWVWLSHSITCYGNTYEGWRLAGKCTVDSQAQRGKHNCILTTFPCKYSLQTFTSVNWNSK